VSTEIPHRTAVKDPLELDHDLMKLLVDSEFDLD